MPIPDPSIKAVLFDLDDTLTDRTACWRKFVDRLAIEPSFALDTRDLDAVHRAIVKSDQSGHRPKKELFAELAAALPFGSRITAATLEDYWTITFPSCMVGKAELIETLTTLRKKRKLKLGIVANGPTTIQNQKIDALGIRVLIDVVSISEAVGHEKPARGIFDATLAPMKVLPEQALFVGDNPEYDIRAAASIGMRTAWMSNGKRWPANIMPRPNFTIDTLPEVLESLVVSPFPTPMFRPSY